MQDCRKARNQFAKRPWKVDHFSAFADAWLGSPRPPAGAAAQGGFRRAIVFVDNAGACLCAGLLASSALFSGTPAWQVASKHRCLSHGRESQALAGAAR